MGGGKIGEEMHAWNRCRARSGRQAAALLRQDTDDLVPARVLD
jgi:hypothetical protein